MFYTIATATTACIVYPPLTALRALGNFPQCLTETRAFVLLGGPPGG